MPRRSNRQISRSGIRSRSVEVREPAQKILVVCEGEKTETQYFRQFPVVPKDSVEVRGVEKDPLRLVQKAREFAREYHSRTGYSYGQVWCVFDRDEHERFRQALQLAAQNKFCVAYSNPAFEIWYLLHFGYSDRPMTPQECCYALSDRLGCPYEKNQPWYSRLQGFQTAAVIHADRLLSRYDQPDPANDNPSTTVHLLVLELNKHLRQR